MNSWKKIAGYLACGVVGWFVGGMWMDSANDAFAVSGSYTENVYGEGNLRDGGVAQSDPSIRTPEMIEMNFECGQYATGRFRTKIATTRAGWLQAIEVAPDQGTSDPTNLFDVYVTNDWNSDLLGGNGVNLANNTTSPISLEVPRPILTPIWLDVQNGGTTGAGTIRLYITYAR